MISKILFVAVFFVQTVAHAAPLLKLKDYTMTQISDSVMQVIHKNEKLTLENKGNGNFIFNGQRVNVIETDTLEQVQNKFERAYLAATKKSALNGILIQDANAAVPLIAVFAAMGLTWAGTHAVMKQRCGGSAGFSSRAPSVEDASVPKDEEVEVSPER